MTTDRPVYRQTDWQQLSNALRWRDNTDRVFTEADIGLEAKMFANVTVAAQ